jgi:hypothetical protein
MPLWPTPTDFRVHVLLRGSSKHEVISPTASAQSDAEKVVDEIRLAQQEEREVNLPWLAVAGEDVLAAHSARSQEDEELRSPEEIVAELKKLGITLTQEQPGE